MIEKKKIKGGYLLGKLLDFILTENELNPTSLGYFQKAISILITKQGLPEVHGVKGEGFSKEEVTLLKSLLVFLLLLFGSNL